MATASRLVSRPYLAVIGVTCLFALVGALYFLDRAHPYYVVHDTSFDGAIVNGITSLSREGARLEKHGRIAIVPHHLVAHTVIAEGVARIALHGQDIRRVVVISPDHFKRCPQFACTSQGRFGTFFGDLQIDSRTVKMLLRSPLFTSSELFHKEHGIYTIIPFVRHYLPHASVVPIVVSVDEPRDSEMRITFAEQVEALMEDQHTAILFSTDFSHYLPLSDAEMMDLDTQTALCARRLEYIRRLRNPQQSDCPMCLWLATTLAAGQGTPHPQFYAHTNSAILLNERQVPETTSHFGVVYGINRDARSCTEQL